MDENITVLVGTGQGGGRNIFEAVGNAGFHVESAGSRQWPRDHYVHFDVSYVRRGEATPEGNMFGEGGYVRTGNGYLLIATGLGDLVTEYSASDFLGFNGEDQKNSSHSALVQEARKYFPRARIHVVPTGKSNGIGHNHLDMSVLLIPDNELLVIDSHYGKFAAESTDVDTIGEQENLKVIRFDGSQDGVWYPLNSLVLRGQEYNVVFVDDKATSLMRLLESEGVKTIGVAMPQHKHPQGKINCQTNTYNLGDDPEELLERF